MTVGPAVCSEYGSCDSCRLQPSLPDNDIIKTLPALGSRMYPGYFRLPVTDNCICNNPLMFSTFGYKKNDECVDIPNAMMASSMPLYCNVSTVLALKLPVIINVSIHDAAITTSANSL